MDKLAQFLLDILMVVPRGINHVLVVMIDWLFDAGIFKPSHEWGIATIPEAISGVYQSLSSASTVIPWDVVFETVAGCLVVLGAVAVYKAIKIIKI